MIMNLFMSESSLLLLSAELYMKHYLFFVAIMQRSYNDNKTYGLYMEDFKKLF